MADDVMSSRVPPLVRHADPFTNLPDHLHDVARSLEDCATRACHDSEWTHADSARALERAAGTLRTVAVTLAQADRQR